MHATSMENMQKCYDRYVRDGALMLPGRQAFVLDVGGSDVNGSYRGIFSAPTFDYRGCDLQAGPGISIVLQDPYRIPLADASVDIVLSGQMLEHCEFFWLSFAEMMRVVKPDGLLFLIVPSGGPIHRYPVDCYRFYPDSLSALAKYADCHLVEYWLDERGPWRDLVGVFSRQPIEKAARRPPAAKPREKKFERSMEEGAVKGELSHLEMLKKIHRTLTPALYLEIGVARGRSLSLARCKAVGVDPSRELSVDLPPSARFIQSTSDDFFETEANDALGGPPDLIFIDGLHLCENALRDFMNAEKLAAPHGLIVIDDIFPSHPSQAARTRRTKVWTGDVWKMQAILAKHRPDLYMLAVDTSPGGLLLVVGLDQSNRVLWERYNSILKGYRDVEGPPPAILARQGAVSPRGPEISRLLKNLKLAREHGLKPERLTKRLRMRSGQTAL